MKVAIQPSHDEAARQNFVVSLKGFVNFAVEPQLENLFARSLAPRFRAEFGRDPSVRAEAEALLEGHPLYKFWATLTYHSQNLLWDTVGETSGRTLNQQMKLVHELTTNQARLGSVSIQEDDIVAPPPVRTVEIHRQPGGYIQEAFHGDISAALTYMGSLDLYRNSKGMGSGGKAGSDDFGRFLASVVKKKAPDIQPKAVLDLGCGTGENTLAYKRAFPEADVTGLDCARPFVRLAHAFAEGEGLALNFVHADAAQTGFPGASFDVIVSLILFHETSESKLRDILKECWRLLRPGGIVAHLDVPYQPHRLSLVKQATNNWQVENNGEPFWTGFVELNLKEELLGAGFDRDTAYCDYEDMGAASYLVFGGRKPL